MRAHTAVGTSGYMALVHGAAQEHRAGGGRRTMRMHILSSRTRSRQVPPEQVQHTTIVSWARNVAATSLQGGAPDGATASHARAWARAGQQWGAAAWSARTAPRGGATVRPGGLRAGCMDAPSIHAVLATAQAPGGGVRASVLTARLGTPARGLVGQPPRRHPETHGTRQQAEHARARRTCRRHTEVVERDRHGQRERKLLGRGPEAAGAEHARLWVRGEAWVRGSRSWVALGARQRFSGRQS